jgi:uncharacterized membrane protein
MEAPVEMNKNAFFGAIALANLVLVGALGYMVVSVRDTLTARIASVEASQLESGKIANAGDQQRSKEDDKKMADLLSDLETIKERMGVTSAELKSAREAAQAVKHQQEVTAKELAGKLAAKADSSAIDGLRQETSKLAAVQQDSSDKIGEQITGLRKDLVASQDDWGRQLVDVKNVLNDSIAKNSNELAELRKKGDRDYFEFDIRRNSKFSRVADIQLALLKTDPKKHKYNVAIQVDDKRLEKRDRTANEPLQFLVGRDHVRYEVVVNSVDKDRIRGYVSAPKETAAANESSRLRLP